MMNSQKYTRQFFKAPDTGHRWADKTYIDHAPVWCSVDLRDGNQALVVPMDWLRSDSRRSKSVFRRHPRRSTTFCVP